MTAPRRSALAIVPVRVGSQRLPGKALLDASGQPLFLHTCDQAALASAIDHVCVATDDDRVAAAAENAGYQVVRTSETPRTGSERCAEALAQLDAELIIDVQGDWPEVDPEDLNRLVAALDGGAPCATLAVPVIDPEKIADPNVVKVVRGLSGDALYFSRAAIPHQKGAPLPWLRHIGVYGFRRDTLLRVPDLPSSGLAEAESLEQLRFLENGIAIRVLDGHGDPWGIETRADYETFLKRRNEMVSGRGER